MNIKDTNGSPWCLLVDEGKLLPLSNSRKFWKLNDPLKNFSRYPIHAAEVVLLGVVPCDKDTEWSAEPHRIIQKGLLIGQSLNNHRENGSTEELDEFVEQENIDENDKRELICRSKCALILGNTIWAKQVQLLEKLQSHDINAEGQVTCRYSSSWTPIFEAKEKLLRNRLAEENPQHVLDLINLCAVANLPHKVTENLRALCLPVQGNTLQSQTFVNTNEIAIKKINEADTTPKNLINSTVQYQPSTECSPSIKNMYHASKSEIIQNHQRAHLNPEPLLEELSDTGLPSEEDLKQHSQNSNVSATKLIMQFRLLKWKNIISMSNDNIVVITWVNSPSSFYIRRSNFSRQLSALEKEIAAYAEEAKVLHSVNNLEIVEGRICIGRQLSDPTNQTMKALKDKNFVHTGKDSFEYKRVQILRFATKQDEEMYKDPMNNFRYLDSGDENDDGCSVEEDLRVETQRLVVCFVDYGYQMILSALDMMPIPKPFVEKLPLQAIECSLLNIQPVIDAVHYNNQSTAYWHPDAKEVLQKFATVKETYLEGDRLVTQSGTEVQFKAHDITKVASDLDVISGTCHVPRRYCVKLTALDGGDHLGMQLIKAGLAVSIEENEVMVNYGDSGCSSFNSTKEIDQMNVTDYDETDIKLVRDKELVSNCVSIKSVDKVDKNIHTSKNLVKSKPIDVYMTEGAPLQFKTIYTPPDLPGTCIEGSDKSRKINLMPQLVLWSQKAKTKVIFKVHLDLLYTQETCISNAYVSIQSRLFELEYLEVGNLFDGEEVYRHHKMPNLDLFGAVDPQKTEVKFIGKQVIVTLTKINTCFWQQAAVDIKNGKPKKVFWIKHDNDMCWNGTTDNSGSDSESEIKQHTKTRSKKKTKLKAAEKIRQTLDQFPKPLGFDIGAKNYDDSTEGLEDFELPSDGSNKNDETFGEMNPTGIVFKYHLTHFGHNDPQYC